MGNTKNKGVFSGNFRETTVILYECKLHLDTSVIIRHIVVYNSTYPDRHSS